MPFFKLRADRSNPPQLTAPALSRVRALGLGVVFIVISGALLQAQGQCVATADRTVKICSPAAGSTVSSPVQLSAAALDHEHTITAMTAYVDSKVAAHSTSASLSASVPMTTGNHFIVIRAWDSSGFYFSSSETITVGSSVQAPSVNITANPMTISSGGTSSLSISAQNATSVIVTGSDGSSFTMSPSGGSVAVTPTQTTTYTAKATNSAGQSATASVTVTVSSGGGGGPCTATTDRTVKICSPAAGSTVSSPVQFSAAALDNEHRVTAMNLYVDSVKSASSTSGQLSASLALANGNHAIVIRAWDSSGFYFSSSESITVSSGTTGVSVSISPTSATLAPNATQQFTATVSGSSNTSLTWSVDGVLGGSSASGNISTSGLYTAPSTAGSHTVTATSVADSSKSADATVNVTTLTGVFTRQYDNARSGLNPNETVLTPANVNTNTFGKLCSYAVDGETKAEPLYVAGLNMGTSGVRNVVFTATNHDSVYAFDAECRTSTPFWHVSFINPSAGITTVPGADIGGSEEYGIVPTPVIDPTSNTIYLLARTKENGTYHQRLHALDLITGAEKFGGPVEIAATVRGTGDGSSLRTLAFDPLRENSRPGMLLLNGVVYMAWASVGDIDPYHGWVIGYDAHTLAQVVVYNATPNGAEGGIWQSEAGIAADSNGNIFAMTGNGTFDASTGGSDYGESFLKLTPSGGTLAVADYFAPFNTASLNTSDKDIGSSGPILLPPQPGAHPNLLIGGSKDGTIYVIDRDQMGHFQSGSNSQIVQTLSGAVSPVFGAPTYWNGNVYFAGVSDRVKAFSLSNGLLSGSATSVSPTSYGYPGATPVVSANGNTNGIVWTLERALYTVLHAYDANNLSHELYNSEQLPSRDRGGLTVVFVTPLVANGRVYMGCNQSLVIYGLLQ